MKNATPMKSATYLVSLAVIAAAVGCSAPAYDSGEFNDLPIDTPTSTEQQATEDQADSDAPTDNQDSGLTIDVGKEGVDVEVGSGVDVEVHTDGGVNVDVGTVDEAGTEAADDQNDSARE